MTTPEARQRLMKVPTGATLVQTVLQTCGYVLRDPPFTNNIMLKTLPQFRFSLAGWLIENDPEMCRVETLTCKFRKALYAYLSDIENFRSALRPTAHDESLVQPSLLHCLLGIQSLQENLLEICFSFLDNPGESDLSLKIITQLKWLPDIYSRSRYCDQLLNLLDSGSADCQCHIISNIPEILPDNASTQVVSRLVAKFRREVPGSQLHKKLMECFPNLEISPDLLSEIRTTIIEQISVSRYFGFIPELFSFLFRADSRDDMIRVISAVRKGVTLEVPQGLKRPNDNLYAVQVDILERIRFCATVNPKIVKIWNKQILDDVLSKSVKKIDLIMVLAFCETEIEASKMMQMILVNRAMACSLFREMLQHNRPMVENLFGSIIRVFNGVFHNKNNMKTQIRLKCLETVGDLLILDFCHAKLIVGEIRHVYDNFPKYRQIAVRVLTNVAKEAPSKLLPFASYLMKFLDNISNVPAVYIRSFMQVLAILSEKDSSRDKSFPANFSILLRKQISQYKKESCCFGVFGIMASVREKLKNEKPHEAEINTLLDLAWRFVELKDVECVMFLDEFSSVVSKLPLSSVVKYCDIFTKRFREQFIVKKSYVQELLKVSTKKFNYPLSCRFDANLGGLDENVAFHFMDMLEHMHPHVCPSLFRVVALLNQNRYGNLCDLDGVLGSAVLLPYEEGFDMLFKRKNAFSRLPESTRRDLGMMLLLTINMFRELINAFIDNDGVHVRIKIWLRLETILKLQSYLAMNISSIPELPNAYPEEVHSTKRIGFDLEDAIQPKNISPLLRRFDAKVFEILLKKPLNVSGYRLDQNVLVKSVGTISQTSALSGMVEKWLPETLILCLLELRRQVNEDCIDVLTLNGLFEDIWKLACQVNEKSISLGPLYRSDEEAESDASITAEEQARENEKIDFDCCLRVLISVLIDYIVRVTKMESPEREHLSDNICDIICSADVSNRGLVESPSSQLALQHAMSNVRHLCVGVKTSETALVHVKLMKSLNDLLGDVRPLKTITLALLEKYLKQSWTLTPDAALGFLNIWFEICDSSIVVIRHLIVQLFGDDEINTHARKQQENDETMLMDVDEGNLHGGSVTTNSYFSRNYFGSCCDENFHSWFDAIFKGLCHHVYKNLRKQTESQDTLTAWVECVKIFHRMIEIAKDENIVKQAPVLSSILYNCRPFFEAFIQGGAGLLPGFWKADVIEGKRLCALLTSSCETIQFICDHSKINSTTQLMKMVPSIKRTLERLLFRVREVLCNHGAISAFNIEVRKHRDLRGREIGSQLMPSDNDMGEDMDISSTLTDSSPYEDESMDVIYSVITEVDDDEDDEQDSTLF